MYPAEVREWHFDLVLCTLCIRAAPLAQRLHLRLDTWDEEGLGEASGFACDLGDGLQVIACELDHLVKNRGASGPILIVDGQTVARAGFDAIFARVLAGLSLTLQEVETVSNKTDSQAMSERLEHIWRERCAARAANGDAGPA